MQKPSASVHRQILQLTLPSVATNLTVPLLGIADTTIVGHMGRAEYIAAIAVCTTLFNMIYWVFAFLRMGTTGLVAQAWGKGETTRAHTILSQALVLGNTLGIVIVLAQTLIFEVACHFMHLTEHLKEHVLAYAQIGVWGAPAMLSQYALTGWFIGQQNTRIPMCVAISQNILNILLSTFLIFGMGLKMEGVALGTVISQYCGGLLAAWLALKGGWHFHHQPQVLKEGLLEFFHVNRDIFLRTLCLVAVTVFFTRAGNTQGELVLSANTLLMQFFILYSYFTDGWANAAEALAGRYASAHQQRELRTTIVALFWQVGLFSAIFTFLYIVAGPSIISLFTNLESVLSTARTYLPWVWCIPLCAFVAMVWDGVFIGLTLTRGMLLSMFTSMLLFFVLYLSTKSHLHNHALWLAFLFYLVCRGAVQTIYFRKLKKNQITQNSQTNQNSQTTQTTQTTQITQNQTH